MKIERFGNICKKAGLAPCERVSVDGIDIYIADGYVNKYPRDDIFEPSWRTVWLIGAGEKGDFGRALYFPFNAGVTKQERIKKAVEDATVFARECRKNGRYN